MYIDLIGKLILQAVCYLCLDWFGRVLVEILRVEMNDSWVDGLLDRAPVPRVTRSTVFAGFPAVSFVVEARILGLSTFHRLLDRGDASMARSIDASSAVGKLFIHPPLKRTSLLRLCTARYQTLPLHRLPLHAQARQESEARYRNWHDEGCGHRLVVREQYAR